MLANRKKLARTSVTPGRTRLVNYFDFGEFILADLPGYGFAKVSKVEKEKWGKVMQTNSDTFIEAKLFGAVKEYLTEAEVDAAPFNTQENIENYVAGSVTKYGFNNNNTCSACDTFRKLSEIPVIKGICKWIHSRIHVKATTENIK